MKNKEIRPEYIIKKARKEFYEENRLSILQNQFLQCPEYTFLVLENEDNLTEEMLNQIKQFGEENKEYDNTVDAESNELPGSPDDLSYTLLAEMATDKLNGNKSTFIEIEKISVRDHERENTSGVKQHFRAKRGTARFKKETLYNSMFRDEKVVVIKIKDDKKGN